MQSVINVIQNRCLQPKTFGDNDIYAATGSVYHAVCLKAYQFSSFNLGDPNRAILLRLVQPGAYDAQLPNDLSLRTADALVGQLMAGTLTEITGGSNYYFALSIKPPIWAATMTYRTTIQGQAFYAAAPYISQNPQSFIAPVNTESTNPLAPVTPNLIVPSTTANPQALAVSTAATTIKVLPLIVP